MKRIAQMGILAAFCLAAYADPILTIMGNSVVSGAPGSIVGWGYQIVNDTGFFLFVDDSAFCGPGGDPQLTGGCTAPYDGVTNFGPSFGIYMDFIANNLTVIGPNSTASQGFDLAGQAGIGQYAINPGTPLGSTDPANPATQTSNLFVTYQEYIGDPLAGGIQVSGDIEMSAPVEVQVPLTPEPGTWILMAGTLLMFGAWQAARSRSTRIAR